LGEGENPFSFPFPFSFLKKKKGRKEEGERKKIFALSRKKKICNDTQKLEKPCISRLFKTLKPQKMRFDAHFLKSLNSEAKLLC